MRAALLSSCPDIGRTLGMLGEHLGHADVREHQRWQKCVMGHDRIQIAADVRERIRGCRKVVVGISRVNPLGTMFTLHHAARSHECAVIMTLEGYRAFVDYIDELQPGERSFLLSRICAVIMVGDQEPCFDRIGAIFGAIPRRHFGGITWAPKTCQEIARLIAGDQ